MASRLIRCSFKSISLHRNTNLTSFTRQFGGYIEDAQLAMFGLDVYRELHGEKSAPKLDFVIPEESSDWPCNLWGYELGKGVAQHLPEELTVVIDSKASEEKQ